MRISLLAILLLALVFPTNALCQTPTILSVEPGSGKAGDVLTARGSNLAADDVAALYLTDGKNDVQVPVIEQKAASIAFRIPPEARPGRFALMVLTGRGKDRKLIEQPVKVVVEPETAPPTS